MRELQAAVPHPDPNRSTWPMRPYEIGLDQIDGKYLTAESGKTNVPIEAVGTSVGTAQQFVVEDAGDGYIAFRSMANR